jgi:K+-transporting ATPase KdpF subunit
MLPGPVRILGLCQGVRKTLRRTAMDYIIAGLAAIGLFAYLIYALLKPERF